MKRDGSSTSPETMGTFSLRLEKAKGNMSQNSQDKQEIEEENKTYR